MRKYQAVLFDLDGTLLDTAEGILNCISYAEANMPLSPLPEDRKRSFIGPPLLESFRREYGLSEAEGIRAVKYYRERYRSKGLFEAKIYPGIPELLHCLQESGCRLAVATLKLERYADKIISHFGLAPYFDCVAGTDEKGETTKAQIIKQCLRSLGTPPHKAVLIGDSRYDYQGAAEAGVDFIGVSYGFGFRPDEEKTGRAQGMTLAEDCSRLQKILF